MSMCPQHVLKNFVKLNAKYTELYMANVDFFLSSFLMHWRINIQD